MYKSQDLSVISFRWSIHINFCCVIAWVAKSDRSLVYGHLEIACFGLYVFGLAGACVRISALNGPLFVQFG